MRLGRAPRAAHGVLPAEPPGDPEQARQRPADHAGHGPGHGGGQHADADEDGHRPQADQLDGRTVQPERRGGDPEDGDDRPDDDPAPGRLVARLCWSQRAATGGIRTARRAGLMADTTVTPTPTTRPTTTVRASKTSGPEGK